MKTYTSSIVASCLAGLLLLPAATAAQQQDDRMARIRRSFPADAADRIARVASEAEADGVPADAVLDKALEGAAKGVPADRVVAAVGSYAERLGRASRILPDGAGRDAVVAGADALRRGAPPEAVRSVGGRAGAATPEALVVLGDLVEAGVPAEQALTVVTEALARGHRGQSLLAVPSSVRRLLRQGTPPDLAGRAVARTLAGKGPPSGVPPVQLPPRTGGPPVPAGTGPPDDPGGQGGDAPPDDPPGGGPPGGDPPGGGGGSGGSGG